MADFNPVYQPVLNTSSQPTRGENGAGIPNEWSRAGDFPGTRGVAERYAAEYITALARGLRQQRGDG